MFSTFLEITWSLTVDILNLNPCYFLGQAVVIKFYLNFNVALFSKLSYIRQLRLQCYCFKKF